MLRSGPLTLGEEPCVAVAIQKAVPPAEIRAAGEGNLLVELRLDALDAPTPETVADFVRTYRDFPLLATIRHQDEGGGWRGNETERLACYEAVLPLVQAVDVEIEAGDITPRVVQAAQAAGKIVIGSFHDFEATPDTARLEAVHDKGRAMGVDVVKVAARCQRPDDLQRLAAFTLAHRADHVIVVGMGDYGLVSRIFFPALGSLVTYTFLGEPTAPGQLNCQDTLKYLGAFYPAGK